MAYLDWQESFSVNVKELDDQHKLLVQMINVLHQALQESRGPEVQRVIISSMVDYARAHFEAEERHMARLHYPGLQAHRREHDRFTDKALELKTRVESDGFVLTLEVSNFLRDWLQRHILSADAHYARHSAGCAELLPA